MEKGKVYLVGAGPGDPDLLTVKAARLIGAADVVVHDGLVDDAIIALANLKARLISVAKQRSRHSVPQEGINAILVREALAGRMRWCGSKAAIRSFLVAAAKRLRLAVKQGFPLRSSPAFRQPSAVRRKRCSRSLTAIPPAPSPFVAGQCKGLTDQNWAGLAGKGRTLVIYMGVATADDICEKLIADGLSPDTPVAVLERVTRPKARALRTLLTDLGGMIVRENVQSPAIIVVGDVVLKSDAEDRLQALAREAENIA